MNDQQQSRADGLNEEQREALEWAADRAHVASLGKPVVGIESRRHRALRNLLDALAEVIPEGCTPADARMLREANHALAAENDALRCALRPFARVVSTDKLSWAMVEYCVRGDPEKQTFQAPQMQRAFNRAADILRAESSQPAAPPIVSAPASDARECLMDVVSHHDSIVAGFAAQRLAAEEAQDSDTAGYWKREIDVAHRMKAQAERALAAASPAAEAVALTDEGIIQLFEEKADVDLEVYHGIAASTVLSFARGLLDAPQPAQADERAASFEAWCDRFPEIGAVERLRDAWQEARAALPEARIDWIANTHCPGGTAYPVNVKNAIREALREARISDNETEAQVAQQLSTEIGELKAKLVSYELERENQIRYLAAQSEEIAGLKQQLAHADARVWLTATVIQKCIESCAAEYLEDVTGHPEDAAYCQGITDCIDALNRLKTADWSAILAAHPGQPEPIDMLLFCPKCGAQHVDAPEKASDDRPVLYADAWTNPPHRSHLCHACGTIWRPADVPTNGVAAIQTSGKADTWSGQPMLRAEVTDEPSLTNPLTPYGMLVRALRIVSGTTLMDMADALLTTPAKLSAMEFDREPVTPEFAFEVAAYFDAIGVLHTASALRAAAARTGGQ
ncbi:hypothetical protein ACRHQP_00710 [Burkholderia pseudomallei]|uniref:hypothetical protein n=1 Tax=Burkholderia pseudomallei TaxID=28450 RepID=UPI004063BFDD